MPHLAPGDHGHQYLALRQRCRTDLRFFMRTIMQNKAFEDSVHGDMIDHLQQFTGGKDHFDQKTGKVIAYIPHTDLWYLTGPDGKTCRKRLILFPRGHMKTTIITVSHTIQWIINYPDVRVVISTATGELASRTMQGIKSIFQYSDAFRYLFPEFCPPAKKSAEFGTQENFTVPNRTKTWLREPTVSVVTIGKVIAGGHYEVIKHSDLVDKENIRTPQQIQTVIDHFGYMNPLLERGPVPPHHGWMDVEGTRYNFSDLYGTIIKGDKEAEDKHKEWSILVRSAYLPDGTSLWPAWFPVEELERIRRDPTVGDQIFSAQYLNNPIASSGGLCRPDQIVFTPSEVMSKIVPRLRLHVTIDLHGMEAGATNDYTAITLAGFDRDGRIYVLEIHHGHFTPLQIISAIFNLHDKYPRILDFKIEKDANARVLLPFLEIERQKRNKFPMIIPLKRDNRQSKSDRIRGLQPFFERGDIRFSDRVDGRTRLWLIDEITQFPSYIHDDILDTLADQLQNRDGGLNSDLYPDPPRSIPWGIPKPAPKFLGFDSRGEIRWSGDNPQGAPPEKSYDKNGI